MEKFNVQWITFSKKLSGEILDFLEIYSKKNSKFNIGNFKNNFHFWAVADNFLDFYSYWMSYFFKGYNFHIVKKLSKTHFAVPTLGLTQNQQSEI